MWPTSTVQQAISAVLCIAEARGEPMRASTIAAATGAAGNYLSKILHSLARAGVLSSERGPRGGFRLALPADQLTLAAIAEPFERQGQRRCLLGRPTCGDANPCPAHERWSGIAAGIESYFQTTTIARLLDQVPVQGASRA